MYLQTYFAALVNGFLSLVNGMIPKIARRRGVSPLITVIIIIGIIAVGGIAIYFLVVSTGPTTTTYP
ncbi:MAG: hypothetical protein OK452_06635 [Thaumarchaeota archaeon]|nr:hypothetical protein [Nitrososphaerota archaeon]